MCIHTFEYFKICEVLFCKALFFLLKVYVYLTLWDNPHVAKETSKQNLSYPYDVVSVSFCWNKNRARLLEKDLLYHALKQDDCYDNRFQSSLIWGKRRAKEAVMHSNGPIKLDWN